MSEQLLHLNVTHTSAKRLSYDKSCSALLEQIQLAELKEKNVLVETCWSGISRGTESLVYQGLVPESEWNTMRCPHQAGEFSFPVSYGYACVGKVVATQSDESKLQPGDMVFVLHPHQDRFVVHEDMCTLLPKELPSSRGVLAANMETALNANWDAELGETRFHAIIGAGVVGLLTAFCTSALSGHAPVIIDIDAAKKPVAEKLGLKLMTPDEFTASNPPEMERIFNTSASEKGLQLAIDIAGFEARIIEMSWYGSKPVTLALGGGFHSKRLQIISSQVGHVAPAKRKSHGYADRMREATRLLMDDRLDALLEPDICFEALPDHVHDIFRSNGSALCQLIRYKPKKT